MQHNIFSPKAVFQKGFTLVELLVVITIIGVLSTMVAGNFTTARAKARDTQRKNDLGQIQRALEMYMNDYGVYPEAEGGKIVVANNDGTTRTVNWGDPFIANGTTYMANLPKDPSSSRYYVYEAPVSQTYYYLYASLENTKANTQQYGDGNCGSGSVRCSVYTSSPNAPSLTASVVTASPTPAGGNSNPAASPMPSPSINSNIPPEASPVPSPAAWPSPVTSSNPKPQPSPIINID